ncbi:uncharacterized protein LOC124157238 isoform X3 [Ischnura elegans]|uniref:uncharacterized protein LOC124157238 isoform X3 n=1 Tax=Ischnura elegans TaxID=197161 RepID=UPI001ED88E15|nr:uncharacterized protein LOC124157238 isoform X3 [Ischnura elegans]
MSVVLQDVWKDITSNVLDPVSEEWWTHMKKKYNDEMRTYHNIDHLEKKFLHFETVRSNLQNPDAVALALFFHYFEYDPKSVDNEERNIHMFEKFAKEGGIPKGSPLHLAVTHLLKSSATHITEEHKTEEAYGTEDEHYFLDLDMVVLGSPPTMYDEYVQQVRQEYTFLPDKSYSNLRLKVLQTFLQIPNIFATREFRDKFEQQARLNIKREVESLKL